MQDSVSFALPSCGESDQGSHEAAVRMHDRGRLSLWEEPGSKRRWLLLLSSWSSRLGNRLAEYRPGTRVSAGEHEEAVLCAGRLSRDGQSVSSSEL